MKILIVAGYADSILKFRGELIDNLITQGATVHVSCPEINNYSAVSKALVDKGVSVHNISLKRTGINPLVDIRTLFDLIKLMLLIKPNAVMAYTIKPVIYGMLAAWFTRVPQRFALITGLGYAFIGEGSTRSLIRRIAQSLYRIALNRADKIFFQNPDDQALFLDSGITNKKSITRVVNGSGVDISQYAVSSPPKTPRFLLIARLLGDKGVREYVEAARIVKQKYPETIFTMVGWIDDNPGSISQYELDMWINEGIIDFKGKLEDVRPVINECSVYVLPSYREGTPRTVLEAMAVGRAIITTDAPGCRETVMNGKNGILVKVKSIVDLTRAMTKFIESPNLIALFGKESREIAVDKYDVRKVNEYMINEMGIK